MEVFQFLWILAVFMLPIVGAKVKVTDTRKFKLIKSTNARMIKLKNSALSITPTLAQCAATCKKRPTECFSFVYNKANQECHLGSWSVSHGKTYTHECGDGENQESINKIDGNLYSSACCSDYDMRTKDGFLSKCVRYEKDNKKSFGDSQKECKKNKGQLITFKSVEEYDFVRWMLHCEPDTWVGLWDNCDDPQSNCNGQPRVMYFVDGSKVTGQVLTAIKKARDYRNGENCVQTGKKYTGKNDYFNDDRCSISFGYLCEKDPQQHTFYC